MASKLVCEPCERVDKSATAAKYCTDCQEYICDDCVTAHRAFKLFAAHHLIDKSIPANKVDLGIQKNCREHPEMVLDFYCSYHDCVCCRTCMAAVHRTCEQIIPLDVAAKGIKASALFDDTKKEVTYLNEAVKQLLEDRKRNKSSVSRQREDILQKVSECKSALIKKLEALEDKIKTQVASAERELIAKSESDITEVNARQQEIKELWDRLNFYTEHGSESQIFILLSIIKTDIPKQSNRLQELISTMKSPCMMFQASDLMKALDSLGSVKVESSSCNVEFAPPKNRQAQIGQLKSNVPSKFILFKEIENANNYIYAMTVSEDNKLLMCSSGIGRDYRISSWTETGEHIQDCTVGSRPWGIAIVPGTEQAVVTLPDIKSVQYINTATMKSGKQMKTPDVCYGIAVVDNTIILGGRGKVFFVDMAGKCVKTLQVGNGNLYSLCPGKGEILYCCQAGGDGQGLYCIKQDGTSVFKYSSPEFDGPVDITSDAKGNLYVTAWRSDNVHSLSPHGKLLDVILKKEDGLIEPYGISFNKNYSKLFVANTQFGDRKILIFNCV